MSYLFKQRACASVNVGGKLRRHPTLRTPPRRPPSRSRPPCSSGVAIRACCACGTSRIRTGPAPACPPSASPPPLPSCCASAVRSVSISEKSLPTDRIRRSAMRYPVSGPNAPSSTGVAYSTPPVVALGWPAVAHASCPARTRSARFGCAPGLSLTTACAKLCTRQSLPCRPLSASQRLPS